MGRFRELLDLHRKAEHIDIPVNVFMQVVPYRVYWLPKEKMWEVGPYKSDCLWLILEHYENF